MKPFAAILIISCTLLLITPIHAAELNFTPRLSVGTAYTGNVFLDSNEEEEEDDFITIVSPGFETQLLGKTSGLELSYDPSYAFFREFEENDGWRHNAGFRAWSQITEHTNINFRDSFILTEDPLPTLETEILPEQEPLLSEDTTVRRGRQQYYRNAASISLDHQLGERDSVGINYVYNILRNDDNTVEDKESHKPSANLDLWFTPHFGTAITGSYTRGIFDRTNDFTGIPSENFDNWQGSIRAIWQVSKRMDTYIQFAYTKRDFDEDEEDYRVYDYSVGFDYTFAEREALSFRVGYFRQDNDVSDDETGIIVDGNLGKTWQFKRGAVNLSASSGYNQSDFGAENLGFEVFYQARGGASYAFTRQLSVNIKGNYRRSEFRDQEPEREDENVRSGFGLNWQPLIWMSLGLGYSYHKVNSNEDQNDYEEDRVFFNVNLSLDKKYRWIF